MKKDEIRKEFFKLRARLHSYNQCRKILLAQFGYETSTRTLQRWSERLNKTNWDLLDKSKRPKTIYYKITPEIENKILLPIWPAKEFVEICKINGWENCNVKEITLEEFENDIIDYISESGYLINVFPVLERTGFIVDLDEFAEDLSNELNKYS